MRNKENQVNRIITLAEMMKEEMELYVAQAKKYEVWLKTNPGNYYLMPDVHTESLKRIMLLVRKETIKLEKMV